MYDYIDKLAYNLRLTEYQADVLKNNIDKYNMGRIVKRGCVLYVPYATRGIRAWIVKFFCGARADLVGQNKILVKNRRNIIFCRNGYYCVKVGPYIYYANQYGQTISRDDFFCGIKN